MNSHILRQLSAGGTPHHRSRGWQYRRFTRKWPVVDRHLGAVAVTRLQSDDLEIREGHFLRSRRKVRERSRCLGPLLRTRVHDFAARRPVQQFDVRAGDAVERHVHQPWCSARDCPCAAADPASAACAAVIWAAATCARRCISPPAAGLSSGDIRSYRRSRYFLTRPISRIVLSPYSHSLTPGGLLGFSSAARGQFECALQRSQRDVQPRFTNRSAMWRSSAICAVVQPG